MAPRAGLAYIGLPRGGVPRGGHEPVDQSKRVSWGTHWVCPQVTVFSLARLNTWAVSLNLQLATGLARVAQVFAVWNKEPKAGPTSISAAKVSV